jgi:hypothetical protein
MPVTTGAEGTLPRFDSWQLDGGNMAFTLEECGDGVRIWEDGSVWGYLTDQEVDEMLTALASFLVMRAGLRNTQSHPFVVDGVDQGRRQDREGGEVTQAELRKWLYKHMCGCGQPWKACEFLLDALEHMPAYDHVNWWDDIPTGMRMFVLYTMDNMGLTEHGGGITGCWLTKTGEEVRDALKREKADEFEKLLDDPGEPL